MEIKLLPYSDEFVQDLHLLPFSPDQARGLSDTYHVLFTCEDIIAQLRERSKRVAVAGIIICGEKRNMYSG